MDILENMTIRADNKNSQSIRKTKMGRLLTYRDLLEYVSVYDLDQSITVFDPITKEFYGVSEIEESEEDNDVLDPGSIVLRMFSQTEESD